MPPSKMPPPTEAELAILRVLWNHGPTTVRAVHEALGGDERTRYTTTLKQMQVMAEKGLLERNDSQRSHIYAAIPKEAKIEESLVSGFIDRVFQGSVQRMLLHALNLKNVTNEELDEIKRLLQDREDAE